MGATKAGEGACLWVSVGCLGQWSRNEYTEGFQQKQDVLWGRWGLKAVPQATGGR